MNTRKKRQVSVGRLLERASQPAYVLDEHLTIVACNDALLAWTCLPLDEIIGLTCHYGAPLNKDHGSHIATGLCPPPSSLCDAPSLFVATIERASTAPDPTGQQLNGTVSAAGKSSKENPNAPQTAPLSRRTGTLSPLRDAKSQQHYLAVLEPNDSTESTLVKLFESQSSEAKLLHQLLVQLRSRFPAAFEIEQLIGESSWAERLRQQLKLAVESRPRALIVGPEGSGREELAKFIHHAAANNNDKTKDGAGPLVPLDCRVLDAELLQTTIVRVQKKLTEHDNIPAGCFLLQEIHALTAESQQELLGLLQLPDFDFHTISTSAQSTSHLLERDDFDSDLVRRLSCLTLELPSLRERQEDLPMLVQSVIEAENLEGERQIEGCSERAMDRLVGYGWPGNLKELRETIKEALQHANGPLIESKDLPKRLDYAESAERLTTLAPETVDLDAILSSVEDELVERAMRLANGNKTRAAEMLGISRARLHRKLDSDGAETSSGQ